MGRLSNVQGLVVGVGLLLTLSVGCGGDDDQSPTAPTWTTTQPVPTPTPSPQPTPTAVDACAVVTQRGQTPGIIDAQSCSGIGSAVVLLDLIDATGELTGQCTGTVITPTAVLAAAHCLAGDVATVTI